MWVVKSNDGICRFPTIEEAMDYMYKEGISSAKVYKEIPDVGDSSNQSLCIVWEMRIVFRLLLR
jgi:hypothetical protein